MAVMWARVPLIWAFDEHHSWFRRLGSPGPFFAFGHMHCSVPQVALCPIFFSSSSLYTHWNLCFGNCFSFLNLSEKRHKIVKYHACGIRNDISRGLWGCKNRRTFAPRNKKIRIRRYEEFSDITINSFYFSHCI